MMPSSPDPLGHHATEPMSMGTPTSPGSPASGYLPSYLLGDSIAHTVSPMSSRLWSGSGGSPPRSQHRTPSLNSPNTSTGHHLHLRKDKVCAPPIRNLHQTTSPAHTPVMGNSYSTPTQYPSRAPGLSTPAPPTTGLSQSLHESMYTSACTPDPVGFNTSHIPASPAQLDPFFTQGEALTADDILDETWITVFGFPPVAASYILQQFSQYGNILKHVIATEGNWMHIHYQSKIQAKKALSKNGKIIGNNIMVGVSHCIDKMVMDKENDSMNVAPFSTPGTSAMSPNTSQLKHTTIRPLTAAYQAARSEQMVVPSSLAPKKSTGFVSKAMEYMFGW